MDMRSASEISYEEWVDDVFVHARSRLESGDFGDNPADIVEQYSPVALEYFARLMRESGALVGRYSTEQIGTGFWHLTMNACSEYSFVFTDASLPLEQRVDAVRSIAAVYWNCFRRVCNSTLCHLERGNTSNRWSMDVNTPCYMWWDVCPIFGRACDFKDLNRADPIGAACIWVMESTLEIDHIACIEGALHGLGHLHSYCPEETERVIDGFLARRPGLMPELIAYAKCAREGDVE